MNGRETLEKTLKEKGLTQNQIKSKTVDIMLEIFSQDSAPDVVECLQERIRAYDEINERHIKEARKNSELNYNLLAKHGELQRKIIEAETASGIHAETVEYINQFNSCLEKCETKEGRDKLRLAQTFVNSCEIESPQNNTAFIYGLSMILSNGELPAEIALKRMADFADEATRKQRRIY